MNLINLYNQSVSERVGKMSLWHGSDFIANIDGVHYTMSRLTEPVFMMGSPDNIQTVLGRTTISGSFSCDTRIDIVHTNSDLTIRLDGLTIERVSIISRRDNSYMFVAGTIKDL